MSHPLGEAVYVCTCVLRWARANGGGISLSNCAPTSFPLRIAPRDFLTPHHPSSCQLQGLLAEWESWKICAVVLPVLPAFQPPGSPEALHRIGGNTESTRNQASIAKPRPISTDRQPSIPSNGLAPPAHTPCFAAMHPQISTLPGVRPNTSDQRVAKSRG
ncbi:hypothetical protein LY76DRAFT_127291 [Colletotrichum caudatum]|nr:hypothetical protein LY76DRAFT_127291 [Colletotrichum caudatum]